MTVFGKKNELTLSTIEKKPGFVVKTVVLPKIQQPDKPEEIQRPKNVEKTATQKFTSRIEIKPEVKTTVASIEDLKGKQVANSTTDGKPKDDIVKPVEPVISNSNVGGNEELTNNFKPEEKQPEFPGGPEALMRFMMKYLVTPDELGAGDMKKVLVKFKVDTDGSISEIQIIQSGGQAFDWEVTRVCKKMPRWSPAVQNGVNVSMRHVLPVTFIGVEE
jgi:protein TonB